MTAVRAQSRREEETGNSEHIQVSIQGKVKQERKDIFEHIMQIIKNRGLLLTFRENHVEGDNDTWRLPPGAAPGEVGTTALIQVSSAQNRKLIFDTLGKGSRVDVGNRSVSLEVSDAKALAQEANNAVRRRRGRAPPPAPPP